eukprot:10358191-Alexandrium_andersonii.AAC.1
MPDRKAGERAPIVMALQVWRSHLSNRTYSYGGAAVSRTRKVPRKGPRKHPHTRPRKGAASA